MPGPGECGIIRRSAGGQRFSDQQSEGRLGGKRKTMLKNGYDDSLRGEGKTAAAGGNTTISDALFPSLLLGQRPAKLL